MTKQKREAFSEYKGLMTFIWAIIKRITKEDYDAVIAITGDEGVGKSSLAYWICRIIFYIINYYKRTDFGCWCLRNIDGVKFDLREGCLFNPDVSLLFEMLKSFERYSCIWLDEAVDLLYKMDFNSPKTRIIIKEFTKDRSMNRVKLLVIPRFTDLTENLRNHRVMYHIHCYERGEAVLFVKSRSVAGKDPWSLKEGEKKFKELYNSRGRARKRYYERGKFQYYLACLNSFPQNYRGILTWGKMPKEDWVYYNNLKEEANKITLEEQKTSKQVMYKKLKEQRRLAWQHHKDDGWSIEKIAKKYNVHKATVSRVLNKIIL